MHNDDLVGSSRKDDMCGKMYFLHRNFQMKVEDDRLSSLPDELIHKILSFISIREAIGLSVLSSRWRHIWTSMPYLNFEESYDSSPHFSKFVSNVLSRRNDQTQVYALKLFPWESFCDDASVKRVLSYAFSHNVQQLRADFYDPYSAMIMTPTWDLPALTTLHLYGITLLCDDDNTDDKCGGLLSKCPNLKNLSLGDFNVIGTNILNICLPRLSNLTLEDTYQRFEAVNVVAPQLKNLTIDSCNGKHMISAPGLTSLVIKAYYLTLQLSTQGFLSLEKAYLFIYKPLLEDVHKIVSLLQQLHSVKFLTVNLQILELLSSSMEQISHQPSPFANYNITSVSNDYHDVCLEVRAHEKVAMSTETENYLLGTSSSSIFAMVSCEEIKVMRKILSAQGLTSDLRAVWGLKRNMLEHGKSQFISLRAHSMLEMQSLFEKMMSHIRHRKIEMLRSGNRLQELISLLQHIEGLVTQLPASKRDVMQATFSCKCEDAAILMNDIIGLYKDKDPWDERMQPISYVEALKLNL